MSLQNEILQHAPRVRAFIRGRVRSPSDAEDVAQETLLKALRSGHCLRDPSRLEPWLYQVARRTIIDHYRSHRPKEQFKEAIAAQDETRLAKVTASVARAALCYLETLPAEYRTAVKLADFDNLSHAEIARRLGISLSATKSRVRRGRQQVRALLEDCCRMVYDARGKVVDYERRRPCVDGVSAAK